MNNVHGIIYAYHSYPDLGFLGARRTGASLPFCSRFRLIDLALSGMMNAGIFNVDIVMQRDYHSLLDHIGSGVTWDMARRNNGLHMLPPFCLPDANKGSYEGGMEALGAISAYLETDVEQEYILLTRGDICANVDMAKLVDEHIASGADITAVCTEREMIGHHHSFILGEDGFAKELLCHQYDCKRGVASLETYIMQRSKLIELIHWCSEGGRLHLHSDALLHALHEGWKIGVCLHDAYARFIASAEDYYEANMDMLDASKLAEVFPAERRVATCARSGVSTYYSDKAIAKNSLIADGCRIEGTVENCIIFGNVKIAAGASLRDCIVMNDTVIEENVQMKNVIADKLVTVTAGTNLCGNSKLPLIIPKSATI